MKKSIMMVMKLMRGGSMTISEELKCCELVLIHLNDESYPKSNFNDHPPFQLMWDYLMKHNFDMISFTEYLNEKYDIQKIPLWVNTAKEFYATDKGKNFYKTIIRNHKLELCLS